MTDAESGRCIEDLAFSGVLRVNCWKGASESDLISVQHLHYDALCVVVLVFLSCWDRNNQHNWNIQLLFWFKSALQHFGSKQMLLFIQNKFEESIAVAGVVESYWFGGRHL